MNNCHKCETPLVKSSKDDFEIYSAKLPLAAKKFGIKTLDLWICRACGLMEVHHRSNGYLGSYLILWHEWWYNKFRRHLITTELQADRFYTENGYVAYIPRRAFVCDFVFQWKRWCVYKGPKPSDPRPEQNTLFDDAA